MQNAFCPTASGTRDQLEHRPAIADTAGCGHSVQVARCVRNQSAAGVHAVSRSEALKVVHDALRPRARLTWRQPKYYPASPATRPAAAGVSSSVQISGSVKNQARAGIYPGAAASEVINHRVGSMSQSRAANYHQNKKQTRAQSCRERIHWDSHDRYLEKGFTAKLGPTGGGGVLAWIRILYGEHDARKSNTQSMFSATISRCTASRSLSCSSPLPP